ncbi:MAG: histidinol-phosphatase [Rhodobiaceae bacterium]|nr:histidinol-phosphatase [Rhodobiaceae bacterium]
MNATEIESLTAFASQLADAAANVTLKHFRQQVTIDNKLDGKAFDPVTIADRDAETAIRTLIKASHPTHGILGEEHGREMGESALYWVLDPIDGTRSFIAGVPLWGTLIALNNGTRPMIGVMDQPYLGERYLGFPGGAKLIRHDEVHPIRTRPCASLSEAIMGTTDPVIFDRETELPAFKQVRSKTRLTRYGADCYFYCLVAAGLTDLVVEAGLQAYDIQALIPIIEGAGGIVTDWQGGDPQMGGRVIAAGDRRVHEEALEILSKV